MKSECLSYFFQLEHEHLIERKLETIVPDSKEKLEDYERTKFSFYKMMCVYQQIQ